MLKKNNVIKLLMFSLVAGVSFMSCSSYTPEQMKFVGEEEDNSSSSTVSVGFYGTIGSINSGKQICNPSISQDSENYPGSMLWLGFSGNLVVSNPPDDYTVTKVTQHDRITISNIDNEVDWFMMRDEFKDINCELQDPEWAMHPDYLAILGGYNTDNACGEEMTHDGFVVRIADKKMIRIKKDMDGTSTPHIWIDPSVSADTSLVLADDLTYDKNGLASVEDVEAFFGTRNVKLTYSEKVDGKLSIFLVDYSTGKAEPMALTKPKGKENYNCESGLISPDGRWIAYNVYQNVFQYSAYMQPLSANQSVVEPIAISETGSDPHWFIHPQNPAQTYVTYVELPSGNSYKILEELDDPKLLASGTVGSTWKKEVSIGLSEDTSAESVFGDATMIINLPFKGGRSPNGDFMCTGINYGYIVEFF